MKHGLIALDIDGTITHNMKPLNESVRIFLTDLYSQGWNFVFITGRTFEFGYKVLEQLSFPYHYAPQNGAILLAMPNRKILNKKYLDKSILSSMEEICNEESTGFVVYAGYETNNRCFYCPSHFSSKLLNYLEARCKAFGEVWTPLNDFEELPVQEFASIKCFGKEKEAVHLGKKIDQLLGLHVPVIKDPFSSEYYVVQSTHPDVTKGKALFDLVQRLGAQETIIAAGDDLNDMSMFEAASVCIAMEDAPAELKALADIIAPSAQEQGIIIGLQKAICYDRTKNES